MKKNLSFLIFIFYCCVTAQSYGSLSSQTNKYDVIPPSQEAYYKSTFGNTAFNDFKGEPIIDIPLLSLSTQDIPLNLNLKYIKSGVKVNDVPNSTGINWLMDTGGIITRVIYDKKDEFFGNSHPIVTTLPLINANDTQGWGAYIALHAGDHEVDIFNYSISGYSGSFYLDTNFQPVLITQDNTLKIETIGNFRDNYAFKITTYTGITYFFGGNGFTESTFTKGNPTTTGVTSFYLNKIVSNKTDHAINFAYESLNARSIILNEQQSVNIGSTIMYEDPCGGAESPNGVTNSTYGILNITNPKRLQQIKTDTNEIINFYYSDDHILYNKLTELIYLNDTSPVRKYSFNYLDKKIGSSLERYYLTGITSYEYTGGGYSQKENYQLEYNLPLEIPERLSKSVDYLGFYNGKYGNTTLIPNTNFFDNTNYPNLNSFANRTSDFNYAANGTLKSITYPTKGKTNFEYEPIKKGEKINGLELEIDLLKQTDSKELPGFEHLGGNAHLSISLYSPDPTSPIKARAEFKILDSLNNILYSRYMAVTKITNASVTFEDDFLFQPNKKYKFLYEIDNVCKKCMGNVIINYKAMDLQNGVGVRLKRQYDTTENDTVNVKRIYYTNFENISRDAFAHRSISPDFNSFIYEQSATTANAEVLTCTKNDHRSYAGWGVLNQYLDSSPFPGSLEYHSIDYYDPLMPSTYFNLGDPMYQNVTVSYGGDHFEKGGEEKNYYIRNRTNLKMDLFIPVEMELLGAAPPHLGAQLLMNMMPTAEKRFDRISYFPNVDGKLLKNKIFYLKNNKAILKRSITSSYNFEESSKIYNIMGMALYPLMFSTPVNIKNKYITAYPVFTSQAFLNRVSYTDYHEDVPFNIQDDSNVKKTVTVNEYQYNNPQKQLTKQTVLHPDNKLSETTYQYASEKNNQKLMNANMVGIPLETLVVEKQNTSDPGKTISKIETRYDHSANLLPSSLISYNKKDDTPSTEVSYIQYDDKGNLLEYKTKEGVSVSFIWGYNKTKPIVKIEGLPYDQLPAYIPQLLPGIILASDKDANPTAYNMQPSVTEAQLIEKLDELRKNIRLRPFRVTTYTYDSLIGVNSITPPSGIREVYLYDSANRLKEIRQDSGTGKLMKEFKYNYKN